MKKPVTFAICGLGIRGAEAYASFQKKNPEKMKIVAIADPNKERIRMAQNEYGIPNDMCFNDASELLKMPLLADVLIIATQDRQHVEQAIPALHKGYHILLEKPISPIIEECIALRDIAHECNRMVIVCHVLRYTQFYLTIKELLDKGEIGEIKNLIATENIAYWHYAHSFVRGNWRRSDESSPIILAKCCHDMDIIRWLVDSPCSSISSFGSLNWFKEENAPKGSTSNCLNGCLYKEHCPYDAEKIYLFNTKSGYHSGNREWPCSVLTNEVTEENLYNALANGPYGRCVYQCDNDVADNQVVSMNFENGVNASFTMSAFTKDCYRTIHIMGSMGEIYGSMDDNIIHIKYFNKSEKTINLGTLPDRFAGHGGGDSRLMDYIYNLIESNSTDAITSIDVSVESHIMALAAEYSRANNGEKVNLKSFSSLA